MKKLILAIILMGFMAMATTALADVTISITIPTQHTARVAAMVDNTLKCEGLGTRACLKKELITDIKKRVRAYEAGLITANATAEIGEIVDPAIN